jgi:hypothetical protein
VHLALTGSKETLGRGSTRWTAGASIPGSLGTVGQKVVELMTERDCAKVRAQKGIENSGKACWDFSFSFQAMFHKAQRKAFYSHTPMAHADFRVMLGNSTGCMTCVLP